MNVNITDCGFFVLRTPLLPFDDVLAWGRFVACAEVWRQGADTETTMQAWRDDLILLRSGLRDLLSKPEVVQALAVASPSLQAGITHWLHDPESKKGIQAERSLVRYFLRMGGRSTPFGLFSGCSVGSVRLNAATELVLAPRQQYRSASRLDFDYLFALTSELRRNPALQAEMRYGWNSSLHRIGSVWHYVESRSSESSQAHHLVKLESDQYLDSVLDCARPGDCTLAEMAAAIRSCEDSEALAEDEITDFLYEIINSEILVPKLSPLLTGKSPLDDLLDQLHELPSARTVYDALVAVKKSISILDHRLFDVDPQQYHSIAIQLEQLPAKVKEGRMLQVDMFKPVKSANLGQSVLDKLYDTLDILGSFTKPSEPNDLVIFRNAFTARYEQEWVPLVEALDIEVGMGYGQASAADGSSLVRDLPLLRQSNYTIGLNEFHSFLLQKVLDLSGSANNELELHPADFPARKSLGDLLPDSFSVMASLVATSSEALQRGEFELVYKGGMGPSCARMLGRFCSAAPDLEFLVRTALREEESRDAEAIYAEIVHLPEGRIGNVLCRPVLRDYEIIHRGRSGAPLDRQLAAEDLLLSVQAGKVVVYSKRLRRRVIPRLSNAHGYTRFDLSPTYRFLCDLQNQGGVRVPHFNWGPLAKLNTLPRVRIGNVILACAQWRISNVESKSLCEVDRFAAFIKTKEFQCARGLPRWVELTEGDNTLPVDFDNPLSVDSLLHLLKRSSEATLVEMYPQPDRTCVTGPEGCYQHELLIPLTKNRSNPSIDSTTVPIQSSITTLRVDSARNVDRTERLLPPGSDWQFVKIYGGFSSLDDLLISELAPLLSALTKDGVVERWFFTRYFDPEPHLRLRFQTSDRTESPALTKLLRSLLADGRLWKIQFDTYRREIERYGGLEATLLSEKIFFADSVAVLSILQSLESGDSLDMRWRIALLGIDTLFTDCGLDLDDKIRLTSQLRNSYASEFQLLSTGKQMIGERFRNERAELQLLMRRELRDDNSAYHTALETFAYRSERIKSLIAGLRALEQRGELANDFFDIVSSYVHMHVNRIIRSSARAHELVLYDFLYRLYDSDRARKKTPPPQAIVSAT